MGTLEILNQWGKYSSFNPQQTKFKIAMSDTMSEYELHQCNENIVKFNTEYDSTGTIACIYAKNIFKQYLSEKRIPLFDVISKQGLLDDSIAMYQTFYGPEMTEIENTYFLALEHTVEMVTEKKMLGVLNTEEEQKILSNALSNIVNQLDRCSLDVFLKANTPFLSVKRYGSHIYVFNTLAECLLSVESFDDGIYTCFIEENQTADGYFGFFLKSNGNIISVNERIDEEYVGEHSHARNARWSDNKADDLFPYNEIFDYEDRDYKGYATKYLIDKSELKFSSLSPERCFTLVLSMILLNSKYTGKTFDNTPIKYVDSLIALTHKSKSKKYEDDASLSIPSNSAIITQSKEFSLDTLNFSAEKVLKWNSSNQLLINLYGDGFQIDYPKLFTIRQTPLLKNASVKDESSAACEFVGTQERIQSQLYINARKQLAEYLRNRMYDEYVSFGGHDAIVKWWENALQQNTSKIYNWCCKKYLSVANGESHNGSQSKWIHVNFEPNLLGAINFGKDNFSPWKNPFKITFSKDRKWVLCPITGLKSNLFFAFDLRNWMEIEELLEADVPKIVKGWINGRKPCSYKDEAANVGTPFESAESRNGRYLYQRLVDHFDGHRGFYQTKEWTTTSEDGKSVYDFSFSLGFSKRGFNKLLAEYKRKLEKK